MLSGFISVRRFFRQAQDKLYRSQFFGSPSSDVPAEIAWSQNFATHKSVALPNLMQNLRILRNFEKCAKSTLNI
jgi:hypothetical protein